MAKMNDRVPRERLGTSRLNDVFLKIYLYDPTSKFQELEIGSDLTFMQSKINTKTLPQIQNTCTNNKGHRQADTDSPMWFCGSGTLASKVLL